MCKNALMHATADMSRPGIEEAGRGIETANARQTTPSANLRRPALTVKVTEDARRLRMRPAKPISDLDRVDLRAGIGQEQFGNLNARSRPAEPPLSSLVTLAFNVTDYQQAGWPLDACAARFVDPVRVLRTQQIERARRETPADDDKSPRPRRWDPRQNLVDVRRPALTRPDQLEAMLRATDRDGDRATALTALSNRLDGSLEDS